MTLPITLEELVPQASQFTLKKLPGVTFHLRPVSVDDELWLQREFGARLQMIFERVSIREICRIVFHQLEEESKEHLAKRSVTIMNEEGEKVTQAVGGADLLRCLISGMPEKMEVVRALTETIGISRPVMDKLIADAEKKSQLESQSQPIGERSSTSSVTSMDGQPNTSGVGHSEKSASA